MPTLDQLRRDVRAKVVGFLFFVGVLADVFGVTDRLDSAIPVVAAFVPLAALAGTLIFGALTIVRVVEWQVDRRNEGPKTRTFTRLHRSILNRKETLLALPGEIELTIPDGIYTFRDRPDKRDAINSKIRTELEILAGSLNELGVSTPRVSIDDNARRSWIDFLARLEVYALDGRLEDAIRLGEAHIQLDVPKGQGAP